MLVSTALYGVSLWGRERERDRERGRGGESNARAHWGEYTGHAEAARETFLTHKRQ